jgi:hypothetical protein
MTIAGTVPAAVLGSVDANGKRSGIFESTTIAAGGVYKTRLTFVNLAVSLVKGTNGFAGVEVYDFGKGLLNWKGSNSALQAVQGDTSLSTSGLAAALGTVTATDAVLASTGATEKNLQAATLSTAGTYGTAGAAITLDARPATQVVVDGTGTASKVFLNFNAVAANLSATTILTVSGTIEFHYEDLGADL